MSHNGNEELKEQTFNDVVDQYIEQGYTEEELIRLSEIKEELEDKYDNIQVLDVDSIISEGQSIGFVKTHQILQITPVERVSPRRRLDLTIYYSGIPTETIAYLDIPDKTLLVESAHRTNS